MMAAWCGRSGAGWLAAATFVALAWAVGCGESQQGKAAATQGDSARVPTYTARVKPIIQARCTPCHFPGGSMYTAAPLDTYKHVKARASEVKVVVYVDRTMPFQGTMPDSERTLIARWVDAGTPR